MQTQGEVSFRSHGDFFDLDEILPTVGNFIERDRRDLTDYGSTELQIDVGPVFRFGDFQVAAMESIRYVKRDRFDNGGTLGQFFFNFGYLFDRGQAGFYFTKANLDEPVVKTVQFDQVFFEETYLKVMDQIGANFQVAVPGDSYVEGNFGYMSSALRNNVPGGVVRFVRPELWGKIGITGELGINEGFVTTENNWRFAFGVRFDDWPLPSAFKGAKGPVPVFVPRVSYETLTRVVRRGNRRPIADAGPDREVQPPTSSGTIKVCLDGTGSSDPDGDSLQFEWTQTEGEPVALEGGNTSTPCFDAEGGQTYCFELVVTDSFGDRSDPDVVCIKASKIDPPVIEAFRAIPPEVRAGATDSELSWTVKNASRIVITNAGAIVIDQPVAGESVSGSTAVSPDQTTTYTLTAYNVVDVAVSAEVTVTVKDRLPVIESFTANPPEVRTDNTESTLEWVVRDASRVVITNAAVTLFDGATLAGSQVVTPTSSTTYTLTAYNDSGEIVSAETTVTVKDNLPAIENFTATPPEVRTGNTTSTLEWTVRNATRVVITNAGLTLLEGTALMGALQVNPATTTTYTLTASNDSGEIVSAEATVTVKDRLPAIESFTASPPEVRADNTQSTLNWVVQDASRIVITNAAVTLFDGATLSGSQDVSPTTTTTYTLTAYNDSGETVSAQATVTVKERLPVIESFLATPPEVFENDPNSELQWVVQDASRVVITNADVTVFDGATLSGSQNVTPTRTTTYTLTAYNQTGETVSASAQVVVNPAQIEFSCLPPGVGLGQQVRVCWNATVSETVPVDVSISCIPMDNLPAEGCENVTVDTPGAWTCSIEATSTSSLLTASAECEVTVFP